MKTKNFLRILCCGLFAFGAAAPAGAANFWVGAGCSYTTVQAAINYAKTTSGSYPVIYIATNQTYSNQAISISPGTQSHITLVGGVPNCSTTTTGGTTTLMGGSSAPVITVTGAIHVTLSHLTISGGHGNNGGGIDYEGSGGLAIDNSYISDNYANNGAGIRFAPTADSDLYINANTFIQTNHAAATGGGIRADTTHAKVHIDAEPIWIQDNNAGDYGGGIAAVGGAYVHIGSPGYLFGGVLYGNTANYGGGIAVLAESTGWPQVDIFAADPNRPVGVFYNGAYHTGGGIYLRPWSGFPSTSWFGATVQLGGAQIDHNVAQEGSAIYTDVHENSTGPDYRTELFFYAKYCAAGVECNTMSNNQAQDIANGYQATAGSTLLLQTDSDVAVHELTMRGNEGAHAIRVVDSLLVPFILDTCLIAGNTMTSDLITFGKASASVNQCTFAYNRISSDRVLLVNADFVLTNSIFAQGPGYRTLLNTDSSATMNLDYVMSMETDSLSDGTHIIQADPGFVDVADGDFHLRLNSPAVDVAPAGNSADHDLDNRPRDQDLPEVSNGGVRDLGAYEHQLSVCDVVDTVFCNGFEP